MMLVIYLSSLIRSVIALHNLINNKVRNISLIFAASIIYVCWLLNNLVLNYENSNCGKVGEKFSAPFVQARHLMSLGVFMHYFEQDSRKMKSKPINFYWFEFFFLNCMIQNQ